MSVGRALVYGGRGALGSTVVKAFKVGSVLEQNTSVRCGLETVKVCSFSIINIGGWLVGGLCGHETQRAG